MPFKSQDMASTVSTHRAFVNFLVLLCYLTQLPIIMLSILFYVTLNLWVTTTSNFLGTFIYISISIIGFLSLAFLVTEIIVFMQSLNDAPLRVFFWLQCIKNVIWIVILAGMGYLVFLINSPLYWSPEALQYFGWTALGMCPFLATLLFVVFGSESGSHTVTAAITNEETPLLEKTQTGASTAAVYRRGEPDPENIHVF